MKSELEKFYAEIESIETAMMTTRRGDGHLRSRAMANQKQAAGADLWFVCREGTAKLTISSTIRTSTCRITATAIASGCRCPARLMVSRDRAKIRELYAPDWKMWFAEEGDPRHGTPDDPRMVLIGVTVHAAEFLEINKPRPVMLFELVKGWVTGNEPELGEMHELVEPRRPR